MELHTKLYIANVVWAIIAVIGFFLLLTTPAYSLHLLSFSESISIIGAISSWISLLTGATYKGQREILKRQDESLVLLKDILKRLDESIALLREIRDAMLRR